MKHSKGFTLVELLIVAVLLFVVCVIVDQGCGSWSSYSVATVIDKEHNIKTDDDGDKTHSYYFTIRSEDGSVEKIEVTEGDYDRFGTLGKVISYKTRKGGISGSSYMSDVEEISKTGEEK